MRNPFKMPYWSPYIVGYLLGVLIVFVVFVLNKGIGVSGAFAGLSCFFRQASAPLYDGATSWYCTWEFIPGPVIDFRFMLVLGIMLGAYISAKLSGTYKVVQVPTLWEKRFGPSCAKRYFGAFFGGMLIMLGAPLAAGCTLSRGIFAGAMLDLSGWIFIAASFGAAIVTAFCLYGTKSEE